MTKNDTLDIMQKIAMSYPQRFTASDIPSMVEIWHGFFKDDDKNTVELAVIKHISTNKWAPSIAEIREAIAELEHPELLSPEQAWSLVKSTADKKRFTSFGYCDADILEAFPKLVANTVLLIGYHDITTGSQQAYRKFMELYTSAYKRALTSAMLPKSISQTSSDTDYMIAGASAIDLFLNERC